MFPLSYRHLYLLMPTHSNFVVNISVCVLPLELLPDLYRYGYATPFYNVQQTVRSIIFGTRNQSAFPLAFTHLACEERI